MWGPVVRDGGIGGGGFPAHVMGFPCRIVRLGGMGVPVQPGFLLTYLSFPLWEL